MSQFRKSIFPRCPKCGGGNNHAKHRHCPNEKKLFGKAGYLWIDITTGHEHCDGCNDYWSLEKSRSHCSCGTVFTGGQIWAGMAQEIGRMGNQAWLRRLGIAKGDLNTYVIGYHRCFFCNRFEKDRYFKGLISTPYAAICNRCVKKLVRRHRRVLFRKDKHYSCDFCGVYGHDVAQIFRENGQEVCTDCLEDFHRRLRLGNGGIEYLR